MEIAHECVHLERVHRMNRFNRLAARCALLAAALLAASMFRSETAQALQPPDNGSTHLVRNDWGMNVGFLADWDGSFAFADAMKHARPWQDAMDWHRPVRGVDSAGWPTSDASTVILTGTPQQFNGTYKLSFQGQADISFLWSTGQVTHQTYRPASNTTTADVTFSYNPAITESRTVGLRLTNTRRTPQSALNSGFTDLRLYRPGYPADGSVVFTRPFLDALRNARVIRMMEWNSANQNVTQSWSQRTRPDDFYRQVPAFSGPSGGRWRFGSSGVAIEHQILLCNQLKADCWFNLPVTVDDAFIQKLALAIRHGTDGLEPYTRPVAAPRYPPLQADLKIYLELGNENWNSGTGFFNLAILDDLVRALPVTHPIHTPATDNHWFRVWRYCAFRSLQISHQFRSVFGDQAMINRVRPVLMTQQGNGQSTLHQGLEWLQAYGQTRLPARAVADDFYGAGGSGYYSVNQAPPDRADRDAFFASTNYPATAFFERMAIDAIWATNYGLKRVAYEGGPSLDLYKGTAALINQDLRMQDLVVRSHQAWSAVGGDLLVYYKLVGAPEWEFTPVITQGDTPKLQALAQLNSQPRARVTLGTKLPGTIAAAGDPRLRISNFAGYTTTCSAQPCISGGRKPGDWTALAAHATEPFEGRLFLKGLGVQATRFRVWVNGQVQGQVALVKGQTLTTSQALPIRVPAGLVVLRLELLDGSANLHSIQLEGLP